MRLVDRMRVLVTGGAGFIGSSLVKRLLELGYEVNVIDDLSSGYLKNLRDLEINFFESSILDQEVLSNAMKSCEVVFHLAASVGRKKSIENPLIDSEINVLGTINVLETMVKHGVSKIIYSSSAAIFGESQNQLIVENELKKPNSQYGVSKLAAEEMIQAYSQLYGIRFVSLRYFNIYGENQRYDQYGNVIPIFVRNAVLGKDLVIFGDGSQTRDFVNVDDIVRLNIMSIDITENTLINVGQANPISILELAKIIIRLTDSSSTILFQDSRPGDVMHCSAKNKLLYEKFGNYNFVSLSEGLPRYIDWYQNDK